MLQSAAAKRLEVAAGPSGRMKEGGCMDRRFEVSAPLSEFNGDSGCEHWLGWTSTILFNVKSLPCFEQIPRLKFVSTPILLFLNLLKMWKLSKCQAWLSFTTCVIH